MFERQLPLNVAFCLILAPVFWGGNFVAGHFLGTALSGPTINLVRWLVALVVLVPLFLPAMMRHWAQVRASWLRLACLGALGVAGFNTVLYEGLRLASVSVAAIAFAVTPLIITVLATVLDRRIPPKRLIVGALIALLGMLAVQADALRAGVAPGGVALVLLAALIWAVYSVALRRGTGALPPGPGFLGQVLFGTMFLIPIVVFTRRPGEVAALSVQEWSALLYLGVFAAAVAFLLWQKGVAVAGPVTAGVFMNLVPLSSLVLGWAILGAPISPTEILGFTVVILGVALSTVPDGILLVRVRPAALAALSVLAIGAPSEVVAMVPL